MSDALNLISRVLLSAVFIVYGYLAFADIRAWLNFNQPALKRFFDVVAGGIAPPTWFGYLIATIQLVGGLAILVGFKTRWVAYAFVAYLLLVDFVAQISGTCRQLRAGATWRTSTKIWPSWAASSCSRCKARDAIRWMDKCHKRPAHGFRRDSDRRLVSPRPGIPATPDPSSVLIRIKFCCAFKATGPRAFE